MPRRVGRRRPAGGLGVVAFDAGDLGSEEEGSPQRPRVGGRDADEFGGVPSGAPSGIEFGQLVHRLEAEAQVRLDRRSGGQLRDDLAQDLGDVVRDGRVDDQPEQVPHELIGVCEQELMLDAALGLVHLAGSSARGRGRSRAH